MSWLKHFWRGVKFCGSSRLSHYRVFDFRNCKRNNSWIKLQRVTRCNRFIRSYMFDWMKCTSKCSPEYCFLPIFFHNEEKNLRIRFHIRFNYELTEHCFRFLECNNSREYLPARIIYRGFKALWSKRENLQSVTNEHKC